MALRKTLRFPDVIDATGMKRATVYREIAAGRFPEPVRLGPNTVAFYEDEIAEWLSTRPRGTDSVRGRRLRRAGRRTAA